MLEHEQRQQAEDRRQRRHQLRPHAADARLAQRLAERPPLGDERPRLRDQHQAVLHRDAEQADQADQRRHVPRLAGDQQRDDAADERARAAWRG